jgi:hypothetical protein
MSFLNGADKGFDRLRAGKAVAVVQHKIGDGTDAEPVPGRFFGFDVVGSRSGGEKPAGI